MASSVTKRSVRSVGCRNRKSSNTRLIKTPSKDICHDYKTSVGSRLHLLAVHKPKLTKKTISQPKSPDFCPPDEEESSPSSPAQELGDHSTVPIEDAYSVG